ncbi:uncharacterized protein LOC111109026 isoform X10 [Crassostrea virginica]
MKNCFVLLKRLPPRRLSYLCKTQSEELACPVAEGVIDSAQSEESANPVLEGVIDSAQSEELACRVVEGATASVSKDRAITSNNSHDQLGNNDHSGRLSHPDKTEDGMDILTCGKCKETFAKLELFTDHKLTACGSPRKEASSQVAENLFSRGEDFKAIMGNIHQASPDIFDHLATGSQCTSICLAAIVAASYNKVDDWNSEFLDSLVLGGDKLHLNILEKKHWPHVRKESRLDIDEMPESIRCQIGNVEVSASLGVHDSSYGYSSYLEALLLNAICRRERQSFILRMHGYCVAILYRGPQQYSVFDPHAKNSFGTVDPDGAAGLFHFSNVGIMIKYLKACSSSNNMEQIDLYPIDVNLLRKSTVSCELVENACIYSKKVSMENEDIISENEEIEEELNDVQTVGGSPVKSPEESSSSLNKNKKNRVKPKRPCPFCGKEASRLTDHIRRKHKTEESVRAAMSLPKELRDREFAKFKKEGIFKVNTAILKEEEPDHSKLLKERKQSNELAVCSLCKGFFNKKIIYRHKKKCANAESTTDYPETFGIGLLKPEPGFSDKYRQSILESFHNSDVGNLIRSDDWIKRYGYFSFKNFEGLENSSEKRKSLMTNLRKLAQLYLIFHTIVSKENPSLKLQSCSQMFNRDYIMYIQEAITEMTTDHSTNKIKNGLKVSLRYLIKDVCKVMRANYYLIRQDEKAEEMNKFMTVLQIIWPSFFASAEESVVKKRQTDLRRPERLPSIEEIEKLRDFAKETIEKLSSDLIERLNYNQFCQLRDAVVCRLTLYNARRGGEPSRMTIKDWEDALRGVWIDPCKVEDIKDEIEKKLLCETKIAYIHASKVAKLVPLLIPKDCWQAIKVLTDPDIRGAAEIHERNLYCFPNVKHSLNHSTGWICVNNLCKKAGLTRHINATDMRHYVATAYALLDASTADREMFYKHLGHSQSMNENVYQCPPAIKTITTVGKFLNNLEENRQNETPEFPSLAGEEASDSVDAEDGVNFQESSSSSQSDSSNVQKMPEWMLKYFLCKMAPDVSISDVLSSLTLIEEEDVTVKPENLLTHRGVLLKKEIQRAARKYFTDDAWLVIESTLKELTKHTGRIHLKRKMEISSEDLCGKKENSEDSQPSKKKAAKKKGLLKSKFFLY